ncbi:MAG: response regulator [Candidatus Omnitrophica bacterium]|nr:response regulator [Candidatus Omnitrophota bacterium]
MKILIVDDEIEVLEGAQFYFEAQGIEVLTARGGHEALALVRACKPHLVMLDIKMKGMSGTEILRHTKAMHPEMPVIMVTGLSEEGLEEECHSLGASQVLHKPVRLSELQGIVQNLHGATTS